jgi:hypothetical protein
MRELYRNPMLYYVLAPILVSVWPLLVWGFYLPQTEETWEQDKQLYGDAQNLILELIEKDPDRLKQARETQKIGKFTYAEAVDRVANLCRIPSGSWDLTTGNMVTSGTRGSQQARVGLSDVGIVQAARFLSTIQAMWVNLTCDRVKINKKEGMPDLWDMSLNFKYDY